MNQSNAGIAALDPGLLFDGAMGTMLIQAGLGGGRASESWILEKPEEVTKVHQAYAAAGAKVMTTCTFGGNRLKLEAAGFGQNVAEVNHQAAALARDAAGTNGFVAGNIGPTGQLLEPSGSLSQAEARNVYAEQARLLEHSGVDFFLLQTFYDLQEMLAAIQGVRSLSSLPIFSSLNFQETKRGFATIMGNSPQEGMTAMLEAGANVVGANCTLDSGQMLKLAPMLRDCVQSPLLIQPNAGSPEMVDGVPEYAESPDTFAANMTRIRSLGVQAVGGCCGTTPEHIRRLGEKLKKLEK